MADENGLSLNGEHQGDETPEEARLLARRRRVAEMYLCRKTFREMAAETGVALATVHRDLKWLRDRWLEDAQAPLEQWRAEELQRIDNLERVAWEAWERSCEPLVKKRRQTTKGRAKKDGTALPDLVREERRTEEHLGDPRYLEQIRWCIGKRCELLGLTNAPSGTQVTVTVVGGIDLAVVIGQKKIAREQTIIENTPSGVPSGTPDVSHSDSIPGESLDSPGMGNALPDPKYKNTLSESPTGEGNPPHPSLQEGGGGDPPTYAPEVNSEISRVVTEEIPPAHAQDPNSAFSTLCPQREEVASPPPAEEEKPTTDFGIPEWDLE